MNVQDIRNLFIEKKAAGDIVNLGGTNVIEILGASFEADEATIFGDLNTKYIDAEIDWYESMSRSVNDIGRYYDIVPKIWQDISSSDGLINSNYGLLIFSPLYHHQYAKVLEELAKNPSSRRAVMIYNRPSIWVEYAHNGMSDFICTNAVSYQIRDGKLHAVVQMRSNDAWAGYRNDRAWQIHVMSMLVCDLNAHTLFDFDLEIGTLHWQVQNMHFYERNFNLIPDPS